MTLNDTRCSHPQPEVAGSPSSRKLPQEVRKGPRRRLLLIVFLLLVSQVACQAGAQQEAPPFASCLLATKRDTQSADERVDLEGVTLLDDEGQASDVKIGDILALGAQNTVQFVKLPLKLATNQSSVGYSKGHQLAFSSICSGWRTEVAQNPETGRPVAFWALDPRRRALVAKFLFYHKSEFRTIDDRDTHLYSPYLPPMPAIHSLPGSRHQGACKTRFSSFITIKAQLELTLHRVASTNGAHDERQIASGGILLLSRLEGTKLPVAKSQSAPEESIWQQHEITMPSNVSSYYKIAFRATSGLINDHAFGDKSQANLHGLAIRDIQLTPECFGLNLDPREVDEVRRLTGLDPMRPMPESPGRPQPAQSHTQPASWRPVGRLLSWLGGRPSMAPILLIIALSPLLLTVLWLLAACERHIHKRLVASGQRLSKSRKLVLGLTQRLLCCFGLWNRKLRHDGRRVYMATGNGCREPLKKLGESQRGLPLMHTHQESTAAGLNYLRPLRGVLPENFELNENPNYLTNGTELIVTDGISATPTAANSIVVTRSPHHVDRKRLTLTRRLGKGAFGEVYQGYLVCYEMADGRLLRADTDEAQAAGTVSLPVAVKTLTDERMTAADFIREANNISQLHHRNIVEFFGVCFEERPLYIIMELLPGGNLKSFLIKNRGMDARRRAASWTIANQASANTTTSLLPAGNRHELERNQDQDQLYRQLMPDLCMGDLLVFALDIARACDYLQKVEFLHRDLAARNCLLTAAFKRPVARLDGVGPTEGGAHRSPVGLPSALEVNANHKVDINSCFLNGYMGSGIVAKLADFGMSRDVYSRSYYRTAHKEVPVRWMPPESLADGLATSKSDVWSFGVLLWELFSMGQLPYQDLPDNQKVIEFMQRRWRALGPPPTPESQRPPDNMPEPMEPEVLAGQPPPLSPPPPIGQEVRQQPPTPTPQEPPLPPPDELTPRPVYAVMCACWATNPEERPQFEELANRIYWCLQMPEVVNAPLPYFPESFTPSMQSAAGPRPESRSEAMTQSTQLNWY